MPAKKPKQQVSDMNSLSDDSLGTITIDLGNGAGTDYISGGAGVGTISIDPSWTASGSVAGSSITWTQDYTNTWASNSVHIDADGLTMKEGADIKIGGKSLTEAIEKIEERLGILKPNLELEERWEQLRELRKQYMELEKDLLEKEKIMEILKKE